MGRATLVPHDLRYADRIYALTSDPLVCEPLGLRNERVHDVIEFIEAVVAEEKQGKTVSRVILNEERELIGVTTLMFINHGQRSCHMGTWIGSNYWGQGYNQSSKQELLTIAFGHLGLGVVFLGARTANVRSQRAQSKLPYISMNLEGQFPEEHGWLEKKEKQTCVLHGVFRDEFLSYLSQTKIDK